MVGTHSSTSEHVAQQDLTEINERGANAGGDSPTDIQIHTDDDNGVYYNVGKNNNDGPEKSPTVAEKRSRYNRNPSTQTKPSGLYYDVQDNPPIHLATMFGFQIAMANIFVCVSVAVLIAQSICADQQFAASLFATTCVMSGLCTILQATLGVRLPMFQGPNFFFTIPYANAASDPAWGCRVSLVNSSVVGINTTLSGDEINSTLSEVEQSWMTEWNKAQGSLMLASCLQIVIGCLGIGGLLVRLMGPISITCLILLLSISIQGLVSSVAEIHWGIACLNIVIIIILSQYINRFTVPMPTWGKKDGLHFRPYPLFEQFSVLISVLVGWLISYILTVCEVFTDDPNDIGYQARTDFGLDAIKDAPIVTLPYPGQYGVPSFKVSYTVVMTVVVMASILESIGDYVQTTGPCRVPIPPPHAVNRGILVEGLVSLLSGAMGAGHATTSHSNNIGILGITKIASRRVFNIAGLMMIVIGIFGKLGAVLVSIPKPVLAGPVFISIALLVGAALANLREVDLWSTRNQGILGISIMSGTVFPTWIQTHQDIFDTGIAELDQSLTALLGMPLVVGVVIAMFLDVTIPGNSRIKVQPLTTQTSESVDTLEEPPTSPRVQSDLSIYNLPFIHKWMSKWRITRFIPFLPSPTNVDPLSYIPKTPVTSWTLISASLLDNCHGNISHEKVKL